MNMLFLSAVLNKLQEKTLTHESYLVITEVASVAVVVVVLSVVLVHFRFLH